MTGIFDKYDDFEKFLHRDGLPLATAPAPDNEQNLPYEQQIKNLQARLDALKVTTGIGFVTDVPDVMMQEEKSFPRVRAMVEKFKKTFSKNPLSPGDTPSDEVVTIPPLPIQQRLQNMRQIVSEAEFAVKKAERLAETGVNSILDMNPIKKLAHVQVDVQLLNGLLEDKNVVMEQSAASVARKAGIPSRETNIIR